MAGRSRRSSVRFHSWGYVLAAAAGLLAWRGAWGGAGLVATIWVAYVLFVRQTNCRVEKVDGDACSNKVAGLLGTCWVHPSAKWRALPTFWRDGAFGLPRLMWPRPTGAPRPAGVPRSAARSGAPPSPPRPGPGGSAQDRRERLTTVVGVAGLVVAVLALVRDFVAG